MPVIFKNPHLPDYFAEVKGVHGDARPSAIAPIIEPYEAARVLAFPELRFDIDHEFWASLPTDDYPQLKKLSSSPGTADPAEDAVLTRRLKGAELPAELEKRLRREITRFYAQALPVYEALFRGYRFTRRQVVWRLNTIRNENQHVDTYAEHLPDHFARLFINLDVQPRIWTTSHRMADLFDRFGDRVPRKVLETGSAEALRQAVNTAAFGGRSNVWWDAEPRHVAYFDPGDVWAVDSRQVAHQIFYGRRAVSIDFFVDPASMGDPGRHYLAFAESFRARALAGRQAAE